MKKMDNDINDLPTCETCKYFKGQSENRKDMIHTLGGETNCSSRSFSARVDIPVNDISGYYKNQYIFVRYDFGCIFHSEIEKLRYGYIPKGRHE